MFPMLGFGLIADLGIAEELVWREGRQIITRQGAAPGALEHSL
jgi:hypothetical protein